MAIIKCSECQTEISNKASACPKCGFDFAKKKKENETALGCLVFLVIFGAIYLMIPSCKLTDAENKAFDKEMAAHEVVENSQWDSSVSQVKSWLRANVKDPDSLKFIGWSAVAKKADGTFMVRCEYRARNSFGGYVVNNQVFQLDAHGNVTKYSDYNIK